MIDRESLLEMITAVGKTYDPAAVPFCEVLGTSVRLFTTEQPSGVLDIDTEGTHNAPGWFLDFQALPIDTHFGFDHPDIGWVHVGFFSAAHLTYPKVLGLAQTHERYRLGGHSLGASETAILVALLVKAAERGECRPPEAAAYFAPPLAGDQKFLDIVAQVPSLAFQFGEDPVPEVPNFPPYKQMPLIKLPAPGFPTFDPADVPGRITFHHWPNYDAACRVYAEGLTKG